MSNQQMIVDLMELFRGLKRSMHEGVARENLSMTHFSALRHLQRSGPSSMGKLAERLDLTHGAVTGIIDRLEQRDLVQRLHSQEDRRMVEVTLTPAGAALQQGLFEGVREHLAGVLDSLAPEEKELVSSGVHLLTEALKRYEERSKHAG